MRSKITWIYVCLLTLFVQVGFAQEKTISGIVSEDGMTLPGATVVIQGTQQGTQTDFDGKYEIKAAPGQVLVFSFIGLKDVKYTVGAANTYNLVMQADGQELEEVVVTAMGIKRSAKALGYATQEVKGEQLNQTDNSSLAGALQGKLAGVQITPSSGAPGASNQFVIRGARSFTGNNTPLYVIDGMPIQSTPDFSTGNSVSGSDNSNRGIDIDPNDIESINILKGQAASALYGIRASNGVVVITTKSGKGLAEGKPQISFTTTTSFETISKKPKLQNIYAQGSKGAFDPYSSTSWGPKISELANDPTYGGNVANALNGGALRPGMYYVPQLATAGLDPWVKPQAYDNVGDYFETGHTLTNSFNISQNVGKTNYSFGIGNTKQDGFMPGTGMQRTNIKLAADTKLNKAWSTGFSGNYVANTIDKANSANDSSLPGVIGGPSSYNLKGIPMASPLDPYQQIFFRKNTFNNPYWAAEHNESSERTNRFYGNAYLAYNPEISADGSKNLTFKYQGGLDSYTTNYRNIFEYGSSHGARSSAEIFGITKNVVNSLFTINYDMIIGEDFRFDVLLGNEFNEMTSKGYYDYGGNLNFGGWATIANAVDVSSEETRRTTRTVGFFGNMGLSWRDMLFLSASVRKDAVSTMPRDNRSFVYPSVSLGWVLTELEGLKGKSGLSFAKVRASYAEVGQAGDFYNDYYYKPSYGGGFWGNEPIIYPIGNAVGFAPYPTIYDPNLKPQNTKSWELGGDFRFFNNKFGIDYTFSRQDVKDQIFPVPLAGSTGAGAFMTNGGKIHTVAHEVTAFYTPIKTEDWELTINANFSKVDSYVDELREGVNNIMLGGFVTPQIRAQVGDRFPVIYGESYLRNSDGAIVVDEKGLPVMGETKALGSVAPKFMLGGSTFLRYKKWNLGATIEWKNGGKMYSGTNSLMNYYGVDAGTANRDETFIVDGVVANPDGTWSKNETVIGGDLAVTRFDYENRLNGITESSVYDASFVKLREISLGYTFNKFMNDKVNLRVSGFARNILLWSKLPNLDPEASQGNGNMAGGFEQWSIPQTKSIGVSVNVTF